MRINPLGMVKNIVEEAGMGISYVFEDLVYLEHTGFLLQFTASDKEMLIHINCEADGEQMSRDILHLAGVAERNQMTFGKGQLYRLFEGDGETLKLEFLS
jgi:hypothetical protein